MSITFATPATTPSPAMTNSNGATGPLASLYSNPYNQTILQYPSDLGSAQKGHIVVFTACITSGAGYDESKSSSVSVQTAIDKVSQAASSAIDAITNKINQDTPPASVDEKTDLFWQPARKKSSDVISLYMPDTLNFSYNTSYTNLSIKDALQDIAVAGSGAVAGKKSAAVASGAVSAIDSPAAKLALNAAGKAINPMNQLVFDGIDFRSFQMAFQFTPKNKAESDTIRDIIKMFRSHAAPQIGTGAGGMLFTVPDSFIIQFVQLGNDTGRNPYITRVKESVLEHIDVNYSPNGIWSTHPDGSPTQINMTLGFKEIQLVDRTQIQNGF
jgi:hypothetical protein